MTMMLQRSLSFKRKRRASATSLDETPARSPSMTTLGRMATRRASVANAPTLSVSLDTFQAQLEAAKEEVSDLLVLEETFPEFPKPMLKYLLQREESVANVVKFLKGRGWKAEKSISDDVHTLTPYYHGLYGQDTASRLSTAQPYTFLVCFLPGRGYRLYYRNHKRKQVCVKLADTDGPRVPSSIIKKHKLSDAIPRERQRFVCSRCGNYTPCSARKPTKKKKDKDARGVSMPTLMRGMGEASLPAGHSETLRRYPLYIPTKAELDGLLIAQTKTFI